MAITKLDSTKGTGSIPFFDDWKKDQGMDYLEFLNEKIMTPKFIKVVTSGKGYMINFDDEFMTFVWKNSTEGRLIKKALVEEHSIFIGITFEISDKGKFNYSFCVDDDIEMIWTEDKFDEGIYYWECPQNNLPPIAPEENRKYLSSIPAMVAPDPVKFTTTKRKPKP